MFRCFKPIILIGGESKRMSFSKYNIKLNNNTILNNKIYIFYKIGFSFIIISGELTNYSNIKDLLEKLGPVSFLHSFLAKKKLKKNFVLFTAIDNLEYRNFFFQIITFKNKYFAIILKKNFSLIIYYSCINKKIILNMIKLNNLKSLSIKNIFKLFLKKILKKKFFLFKNFILNLNTELDLKINKQN